MRKKSSRGESEDGRKEVVKAAVEKQWRKVEKEEVVVEGSGERNWGGEVFRNV